MTYKEYCEDAEITITITLTINDEIIERHACADIDGAIEELGAMERREAISNALDTQWNGLPDDTLDDQPEGDFTGASYDPDFGGR